jgi:hypothetical protein
VLTPDISPLGAIDSVSHARCYAVAYVVGLCVAYRQYPQDSQQILISAQSYGLNKNFVSINFTSSAEALAGYSLPSPVSFITVDGTTNFKVNPLWTYNSFDTLVYNPNFGSAGAGATKDTLYVYLNIVRQSSGIIYRLAVPIMLLLVLVGLTFWSEYSGRVDTTITLLLAISALYIVIFQSIPMLGYLTDFDIYIITMFFLIVLTVILHQVSNRLQTKAARLPLRKLALRVIEIAGKVLVIPGVLISFFWTFTKVDMGGGVRDTMTAVCVCVSVYILLREAAGFRQDVTKAMALLRTKMEDPEGRDRKVFEVLIYNLYTFGVFSTSLRHVRRREMDGAGSAEGDGVEMQIKPNVTSNPLNSYSV